MLKILNFAFFLIWSINILARTPIRKEFLVYESIPDTLYFPFNNNTQLIVINKYDTWMRQLAYLEATHPPQGQSWERSFEPTQLNIYIFRNNKGAIIKSYNTDSTKINQLNLKNTNYINTNDYSINLIYDYGELNYLRFNGENNKVGLINLKGDIVLPAIYDDISIYNGNQKRDRIIIHQDSMFGFLDLKLNVLFQPIYTKGSLINERYLQAYNKAGKCGLINENGDILIDFKFDNLRLIHDTMYVGFDYSYDLRNKKYFAVGCIIYDKNFKQITQIKNYDQIEYNGIKRFIVKKDNKFGVLNYNGEVIVPLEYDNLTPQNGDYYVFKDNKSGMINLEGKIVLPIEFERNTFFYGQAIYVIQNGLIGVYTDEYKLIAKPQFKYKYWDMGKYVLVKEDGTKGFVMHLKEGSYYQSPEGETIKF